MGLIKEKLEVVDKNMSIIVNRIGSLVDMFNKDEERRSNIIRAIVEEAEKLNIEHNQYHAYYYCANVEKALEKRKEK